MSYWGNYSIDIDFYSVITNTRVTRGALEPYILCDLSKANVIEITSSKLRTPPSLPMAMKDLS